MRLILFSRERQPGSFNSSHRPSCKKKPTCRSTVHREWDRRRRGYSSPTTMRIPVGIGTLKPLTATTKAASPYESGIDSLSLTSRIRDRATDGRTLVTCQVHLTFCALPSPPVFITVPIVSDSDRCPAEASADIAVR